MFTLAELEDVIPLVRSSVVPTPQYAWPLLKAQTGVEVVVKHENDTPVGAFKVRGGIFTSTGSSASGRRCEESSHARQPRSVAGIFWRTRRHCCDDRGAIPQLD